MLRSVLAASLAAIVLVIPAVGGEDPPPVEQKDVLRSQGNLKQIGIAFHEYADSSVGNLPIDIRDKDGKALLSWRVTILPYVEENELYKQFKLDEPWDSANNKKLIEKIPKIYAPVRVKAKEGETFYQVFTGEKAVFGPKKNPRLPASFPDGTSNTGLVFEAGDPVIWSKPADMVFDEKKPSRNWEGLIDGECNVVLGDGSVVQLRRKPNEKELKKLIMPDDGQPLNFDILEKGGKN